MTAAFLAFVVGLVVGAAGGGWPLFAVGLAAAVWVVWWVFHAEREPTGRWWGES